MLILKTIEILFLVYTMMLFARIIGSWFPDFSQSRFMQFIAFYTDPYLNIFRRIIPPLGMLDLSPIVAFFALQILENVLKMIVIRFFL
ncbi:MAG: YggT family protein [Parachlamydiaceae bacterium]